MGLTGCLNLLQTNEDVLSVYIRATSSNYRRSNVGTKTGLWYKSTTSATVPDTKLLSNIEVYDIKAYPSSAFMRYANYIACASDGAYYSSNSYPDGYSKISITGFTKCYNSFKNSYFDLLCTDSGVFSYINNSWSRVTGTESYNVLGVVSTSNFLIYYTKEGDVLLTQAENSTVINRVYHICEVYAPVLSSGITSLNAAFMRCLNLKEPPEIPDTVIDMSFAFESCLITEAPVLPSGLIYATCCFQMCPNLVSTNNLNISTLTNCTFMFNHCTKLTTVQNLPPNMENMFGMFFGCTSLKTLGSVTIPSSVTNMRLAFRESGLTKAPILPIGVTDVTQAFFDCYDLRNVPYIPSTVTEAQSCFEGCSALEIIDEFEIALEILRDNTSFKDMFKDCTSLKEIGYNPHFSNDWHLFLLDIGQNTVEGKIYSRNKTSITIPQTTITKSTLTLPVITDELMFSQETLLQVIYCITPVIQILLLQKECIIFMKTPLLINGQSLLQKMPAFLLSIFIKYKCLMRPTE